MPEPVHAALRVSSDAEVEIVRDDCDCAADAPFAQGCPRLARLAALVPDDR